MNVKKTKQKIRIFWPVFLLLIFGLALGLGAAAADGGSLGDLSIKNQLQAIARHPKVNLGGQTPVLTTVIGKILFGVLGFLGVVSLLLIIYAGIKWMLADGQEETIGEAKKIIFYAIIGLVIIMGSYAITYYVVDKFAESTLKIGPEEINIANEPQFVGEPAPIPDDFTGCLSNFECEAYCSSDGEAQCIGKQCFCAYPGD